MKRQKYVDSLKKGSVLWKVCTYITEDGRRHVDVDRFVVSSIRNLPKPYWNGHTFLRGCIKTIYVRDFDGGKLVSRFTVGDDLPRGFYTTQLQALKFAKFDVENSIKWYEEEIRVKQFSENVMAEYHEELNDHVIMLRNIKGKITKLKKANK
ncbi:hypothetical protein NVP3058O_042 [Vibrio phage 3.058.O._10N.286.46.B8]|nr:hypothetical protein NVP2058O_043 [Vibrio phage 2.058.O._10N.286.46.B8]AUS03112.1 hypothetical protein NVP3058O_042 [Vibrio phage 3.058.O._10N.286.46.B8]